MYFWWSPYTVFSLYFGIVASVYIAESYFRRLYPASGPKVKSFYEGFHSQIDDG